MAGRLVCERCGERIGPARAPGRFTHRARRVAACDLDGDHEAVPDPGALGPLTCRRCGGPVVVAGGGLTHADPAADGDHAADPALPVG
jgi:hypothetical protein